MAPPNQALLAARALKYRCALSGHAFRNCLETFGEDESFENVARFLDIRSTVLRYCLRMQSDYNDSKE